MLFSDLKNHPEAVVSAYIMGFNTKDKKMYVAQDRDKQIGIIVMEIGTSKKFAIESGFWVKMQNLRPLVYNDAVTVFFLDINGKCEMFMDDTVMDYTISQRGDLVIGSITNFFGTVTHVQEHSNSDKPRTNIYFKYGDSDEKTEITIWNNNFDAGIFNKGENYQLFNTRVGSYAQKAQLKMDYYTVIIKIDSLN